MGTYFLNRALESSFAKSLEAFATTSPLAGRRNEHADMVP